MWHYVSWVIQGLFSLVRNTIGNNSLCNKGKGIIMLIMILFLQSIFGDLSNEAFYYVHVCLNQYCD